MGSAGHAALYPFLCFQFLPLKDTNQVSEEDNIHVSEEDNQISEEEDNNQVSEEDNNQMSEEDDNNQVSEEDDKDKVSEKDNNQELADIAGNRASVWEMAAGFLGTFTCWAFASSLDWNYAFMVTFILVTVAYLLFCCGRCYYKHLDPTKETAASRMIQAKRLVKLIPLCLTFIPYSLVNALGGDTLFVLQSYRMKSINIWIPIGPRNRVPINSLHVFRTLIKSIMSMSSNFLIRKLWSSENAMRFRAGCVRIGVGMLFAFGSCLSAWLVEVRILNLMKKNGTTDDNCTIHMYDNSTFVMNENCTIPMNIIWLAPQYGLLGIANGLVDEGMSNFFYDCLPQSMKFFVVPLMCGVMGVGSFISGISVFLGHGWIDDTVKETLLHKYFRMLTILNISVIAVYTIMSYMFDWSITETGTPMEEVDE
ncbi:hypothetical protein DITRI_Ditri05aG0079000 [Diplodiscus trichospermus]